MDAHSNSTALVQATHKLQVMESELAQLKAQHLLLQREVDLKNAEVNKLKGSLSHSGERMSSTDAETRRVKAHAQVGTYLLP